jgi:hypothetical protein
MSCCSSQFFPDFAKIKTLAILGTVKKRTEERQLFANEKIQKIERIENRKESRCSFERFRCNEKTGGGKKRREDAEKMKRCKKQHFEAEKGVRQKKYKFAAGKSCSLFQ